MIYDNLVFIFVAPPAIVSIGYDNKPYSIQHFCLNATESIGLSLFFVNNVP